MTGLAILTYFDEIFRQIVVTISLTRNFQNYSSQDTT